MDISIDFKWGFYRGSNEYRLVSRSLESRMEKNAVRIDAHGKLQIGKGYRMTDDHKKHQLRQSHGIDVAPGTGGDAAPNFYSPFDGDIVTSGGKDGTVVIMTSDGTWVKLHHFDPGKLPSPGPIKLGDLIAPLSNYADYKFGGKKGEMGVHLHLSVVTGEKRDRDGYIKGSPSDPMGITIREDGSLEPASPYVDEDGFSSTQYVDEWAQATVAGLRRMSETLDELRAAATAESREAEGISGREVKGEPRQVFVDRSGSDRPMKESL